MDNTTPTQLTGSSSAGQSTPPAEAPTGLFARLWAARFRMLIVAVLVAGAMGGMRLHAPRTYVSSATVLFPAAGATSRLASLTGVSGGDMPSIPLMEGMLTIPRLGTAPDTATVLLRSHKTVSVLMQRFQFEWAKGVTTEQAQRMFLKRLTCATGRAGDLQIAFEDEQPKVAQAVVAAALDHLEQTIDELRLDPAARSIHYLQKKIDQAEVEFEQAQDQLAQFQESHAGAPPDQQVQWLGQRLSEVEADLGRTEVEANAAAAKAKLTSRLAAQMLRAAQDPQGNGQSFLATQYRAAVAAEAKLTLLKQTYTDQAPEVVQARYELDGARKTLRGEMARQISGLGQGESPYVSETVVAAAVLRAKTAGLRQTSAGLRGQLERLPRVGATYARLMLEVESKRKLLVTLRPELERAQVAAESDSLRFAIVDPPVAPQEPTPRRLLLTSAAGFILGLVLMAVFPYVQWAREQYTYQQRLDSLNRPSA